MNGQEFATAVQYDLPIIVLLMDNGMYGTIRAHQEREFPGRVIGTFLRNPDFAAYAEAVRRLRRDDREDGGLRPPPSRPHRLRASPRSFH
jgi:thiamine pyrophosphate-dependent acetolactate synthase large subunit-like protein